MDINKLLNNFKLLSPQKKLYFLGVVAFSLFFLFGVWSWSSMPEYRLLYSGLSSEESVLVVEEVKKMGLKYDLKGNGESILVPSENVAELRLKFAALGIPKNNKAGFEILEKQKFGTSSFLEQVNYQRALEGELAQSIQSIGAVNFARVHLAIPKSSVFVQNKSQPSASVVVGLRSGRVLNDEQISSIVALISTSVPNLNPKSVSVVDQNGNLLASASSTNESANSNEEIKIARKIESEYQRRVEEILAPLVGSNNVLAQVNVELDFSKTEQTEESYRPNSNPETSSIRSQQTNENHSPSQSDKGVPGAVSNSPPTPSSSGNSQGSSVVSAGDSWNKSTTTNYELDKTAKHTVSFGGNIKRISLAVLLNNKIKTVKGKVVNEPFSKEEMTKMESLAKEAIGFNESRGDTVAVSNQEFSVQETIPPEESPIWENPNVIAWVKLVVAALISFIVLFKVVKPLFQRLSFSDLSSNSNVAGNGASATDGLSSINIPTAVQVAPDLSALKELAKNDPRVVASVVQDWINQ